MVETDWREILSFSQRELGQADKEKLCESLSWMEADDIELNFSDLKSLFRLAQDILKYKNEQVNGLLGQLESGNRKSSKKKGKASKTGSPASTDSGLDTVAHQEEIIKANKEILEQLSSEIAELEGRKSKMMEESRTTEEDSESSRDALSEMNAVVQLENEVALKNRHIRKLLGDIKTVEDENIKLKEKISVLKDKLTEATQLIDSLTEQMLSINNECVQFKGKTEHIKAQQASEIESLQRELFQKESKRENIYDEIKSKVQHWKTIAKIKKSELEAISIEYGKLKEELTQASKTSSPKEVKSDVNEAKIKELQDKLTEASNEIEQSAKLISLLRTENRQLKGIIEETPDFSVSDHKNESDDGKERILITKLKRKIKGLTINLKEAEEMIAAREKELAEVSSELLMLQTDEGINSLLIGLKQKKRELKVKDEGIKSLVQEINSLSQKVNDLQLENETMRSKLNIPVHETICTNEIAQKYRDIENNNALLCQEVKSLENKLVNVELINRKLNIHVSKLKKVLESLGWDRSKIENVLEESDNENTPEHDKNEIKTTTSQIEPPSLGSNKVDDSEMKAIVEENEGLRKGLQEILDFLKDNSKTTSGILLLQCPSLEALLRSMEARHTAGWFSPHMSTVMELRQAIGSKDALLTALHEARIETFNVMSQLSKETEKSLELERKLKVIESKEDNINSSPEPTHSLNQIEFGTWISDKDQTNIDFKDKLQIQDLISKGNSLYENQLKNGLEYFCTKFQSLHDRITSMAIQAADDQNKWSLQEEQYTAEIENLRSQIQEQKDEDISDISPGLVSLPSCSHLQRKCTYLEESYKYIRTLNENMKNENMEVKKEITTMSSEYEAQIQKLILAAANLTDKLRSSVPIELFWKQNSALNDVNLKYRHIVETNFSFKKESFDLFKRLDDYKYEIINSFRGNSNVTENIPNIEDTIFKKQLQELCIEIEAKDRSIEQLENRIKEMQEAQSKLVDKSLASSSQQEIDFIKNLLDSRTKEAQFLKERCQHISSQLDVALIQLQEYQQRQLSNDIEVNMLRHQILDLQSTSDNKAIVSRLSGEVLVAHLQASESHKKIENLTLNLNKEKELRVEAEEMLKTRQKIFDLYSLRFESKFRYMFEIIQILRQQYQGSIPLASVENYLVRIEDLSRESRATNEKLQDIEELRSNLMAKHSVFDQILDVSRNKCLFDEDSCQHKLKVVMLESMQTRELDHLNKKIMNLEQCREDLFVQCNKLETTLVLVNQAFDKTNINDINKGLHSEGEINVPNLELEDVQSDDDSISIRDQTITLPKPQMLKPNQKNVAVEAHLEIIKKDSPKNTTNINGTKTSPVNVSKPEVKMTFAQTQTISFDQSIRTSVTHAMTQTVEDNDTIQLKQNINTLKINNERQSKELTEAMSLIEQRIKENLNLNTENINLEANLQTLKSNLNQKIMLNERLRNDVEELKNELEIMKTQQIAHLQKKNETTHEENKSLVTVIKQLETDKNTIVKEYNDLLKNEREEYANTIKELNLKVMKMQTELDRKASDPNGSSGETTKDIVSKFTIKFLDMEDQCFRLQNELDDCKNLLLTYQSEADRWKALATERLAKMEHLNSQLEQRHSDEVDTYKAENEHWMSQLSENQKEHMELRAKLTEQKALYVKQISEKDSQLEQMRNAINNLKAQIMNMQTMISVHDPSFDLSAIVEVEEVDDMLSHHGSDRLEIKFDSSDFHDISDDFARIPSSSTAIWQEPVIERLRRDKQLVSKQNAILRRQIKALAARERRSRLDAQNLKNQVFRISTTGNRVTTAETAALHNKIATLQAQLTSCRRDTHSSIALWDKWKKSQQAAERWQARFEEKFQEVKKLETSLSLSKSQIARLEKEKRVLLAKLNEYKSDTRLTIEKQENETPEKSQRSVAECVTCLNASALSNQALLDRVQAQQRRIAALEVAEKGNEVLVSEYEKALAEITSLKGQVLKLESTLLESQIRSPIKTSNDTKPELEYWKSYCEMLKEENVQLNLRLNSMESSRMDDKQTSVAQQQHRINDLEQTILTLRGLVSKLQSEQKSGHRKIESRPSSGRSTNDKNSSKLESHRIEIVNLKRTIQEKDLLLERSKEMLKIAAEREDDLLRENAFLRRQIEDLTRPREGFQSA